MQTIIEPGKIEKNYWMDSWRFRELFFVLAKRDLLVRYKQTLFGIIWAFIRPLITTLIFVLIFKNVANLPSEGIQYPLFVYAGIVPWTFFSSGLSDMSSSLISSSNLISKIYFPRVIIPFSTLIVTSVDTLISICLLFMIMMYYGYYPSFYLIFIPFLLFLTFLLTLGLGLIISSLNVKYRDFRYAIPFMIQLSLYLSPVGFSSLIVPVKYQYIFYLNPLVGIIDGFRWSITGGTSTLSLISISFSTLLTFFILFIGIVHFRRTEAYFADVI